MRSFDKNITPWGTNKKVMATCYRACGSWRFTQDWLVSELLVFVASCFVVDCCCFPKWILSVPQKHKPSIEINIIDLDLGKFLNTTLKHPTEINLNPATIRIIPMKSVKRQFNKIVCINFKEKQKYILFPYILN